MFIYYLVKKNGTLYIGVTNNLIKRIYEHKNKFVKGFTEKYKVDKLGYFEQYNSIEEEAIKREKQLKNWKRNWKIALIERNNDKWEDLYLSLIQ